MRHDAPGLGPLAPPFLQVGRPEAATVRVLQPGFPGEAGGVGQTAILVFLQIDALALRQLGHLVDWEDQQLAVFAHHRDVIAGYGTAHRRFDARLAFTRHEDGDRPAGAPTRDELIPLLEGVELAYVCGSARFAESNNRAPGNHPDADRVFARGQIFAESGSVTLDVGDDVFLHQASEIVAMQAAFASGDHAAADAAWQRIRAFSRFLDDQGRAVAICKAALTLLGLPGGEPRRPLPGLSDEEREALRVLFGDAPFVP